MTHGSSVLTSSIQYDISMTSVDLQGTNRKSLDSLGSGSRKILYEYRIIPYPPQSLRQYPLENFNNDDIMISCVYRMYLT